MNSVNKALSLIDSSNFAGLELCFLMLTGCLEMDKEDAINLIIHKHLSLSLFCVHMNILNLGYVKYALIGLKSDFATLSTVSFSRRVKMGKGEHIETLQLNTLTLPKIIELISADLVTILCLRNKVLK